MRVIAEDLLTESVGEIGTALAEYGSGNIVRVNYDNITAAVLSESSCRFIGLVRSHFSIVIVGWEGVVAGTVNSARLHTADVVENALFAEKLADSGTESCPEYLRTSDFAYAKLHCLRHTETYAVIRLYYKLAEEVRETGYLYLIYRESTSLCYRNYLFGNNYSIALFEIGTYIFVEYVGHHVFLHYNVSSDRVACECAEIGIYREIFALVRFKRHFHFFIIPFLHISVNTVYYTTLRRISQPFVENPQIFCLIFYTVER